MSATTLALGNPLVFEDQKDIKGIVEVAAKDGIG
jgi:hypothetical protein